MGTINVKFIAFAAIAVTLIAFGMHNDYLRDKVKFQKAEIEIYKANSEHQAKQIKLADSAKNQYLTELSERKNEIDNLRGRVESGASVVRIKASCPKMPIASPNPARVVEQSPELTAEARQYYFDLREAITETNGLLNLCISTLKNDRGLE